MKTIFSDIDGTFYEFGKEVPTINIEAVRAFQEQGDRFVFISGRSAEQIQVLLEETGISCDTIFGNGVGYQLANEKPTYQNCLSAAEGQQILGILDKYSSFYHVHTSAGIYLKPMIQFSDHLSELREKVKELGDFGKKLVDFKEDYFTNECEHVESPAVFLKENPEVKIVKFEVMSGDDAFLEKLKSELEAHGFYVFSSIMATIEIVNPANNKGDAIKSYLELFPSVKTYGVGDAENDLAMLEVVDVALAVGNASDIVKENCDIIISDCGVGGLGKFMYEELIENK